MGDGWSGTDQLQWNSDPDVVGVYRVRVARTRPQDDGKVWHYYGVPVEVIDALAASSDAASSGESNE